MTNQKSIRRRRYQRRMARQQGPFRRTRQPASRYYQKQKRKRARKQ